MHDVIHVPKEELKQEADRFKAEEKKMMKSE